MQPPATQSWGTQGWFIACPPACLASFLADLCPCPGSRLGPGRQTHLRERSRGCREAGLQGHLTRLSLSNPLCKVGRES